MQKPQIIVIPQNLLSEQSKSFLKQRMMLPAPPATISSRPVAAVVGNKRPLPPLSPPELVKKRPAAAAPALLPVEVKVEADDEGMDEQPARKRANLDHLSADERLMRRKLKNRVAAQTARDKKKAYIDELEAEVNKLKSEKLALETENARLKASTASLHAANTDLTHMNASLVQRNHDLEQRLGLSAPAVNVTSYNLPPSPAVSPRPTSPPSASCTTATAESNGSAGNSSSRNNSRHVLAPTPEPAVLATPLPQETGASTLVLLPPPLPPTPPPPDPGLSSNDLTTWSSCSLLLVVLLQMAMLSGIPNSPSSNSLKARRCALSATTSLPLCSADLLPPKKRRSWSAEAWNTVMKSPPLPPPPPLTALALE